MHYNNIVANTTVPVTQEPLNEVIITMSTKDTFWFEAKYIQLKLLVTFIN